MREGKRFAVWFVFLAIVVIAGDRIGAFVCSRILLASQFRFSRVYRGDSKADVIVIGDSRGVHSFYAPAIEKLTGHPALNLSFNSMSVPIAEALLSDYLENNTRPRMVIIEATCVVVDRGLVSELRTYAGLSPRLEALYAREHPAPPRAGRMFGLLHYEASFSCARWCICGAPIRTGSTAMSSPGSWLPLRAADGARAPTRRVSRSSAVSCRCCARGIDVKLVIAPYHPSVMVDMNEIVQGVERHVPGARVLNYADAIPESRYFADGVHMNADGSEVFLRMLRFD